MTLRGVAEGEGAPVSRGRPLALLLPSALRFRAALPRPGMRKSHGCVSQAESLSNPEWRLKQRQDLVNASGYRPGRPGRARGIGRALSTSFQRSLRRMVISGLAAAFTMSYGRLPRVDRVSRTRPDRRSFGAAVTAALQAKVPWGTRSRLALDGGQLTPEPATAHWQCKLTTGMRGRKASGSAEKRAKPGRNCPRVVRHGRGRARGAGSPGYPAATVSLVLSARGDGRAAAISGYELAASRRGPPGWCADPRPGGYAPVTTCWRSFHRHLPDRLMRLLTRTTRS